MSNQLIKSFVKECLVVEAADGAAIADAGKQYELKLSRSLRRIGVAVGETAGFSGGADVTVLDADGVPYGIEAKVSKTADMGSAALKYDPRRGVITASDPSSPVGVALAQSGALDAVNADAEFLESVDALSSAGLLSRAPAEKLLAFRKKFPQYPTQTGRTIQLGRSDLITQHYAAKGENVEYIQIMGQGLYIFGGDPLNLAAVGAAQFDVNVSLSIKVAQKGSSSPGKMSSLSMSAKIKLAGGLPSTGVDLDDPEGLLKLKAALGYDSKPTRRRGRR